MKRIVLCVAALAAVSTVLAGFKYEGEWGKLGPADGEFNEPLGVGIAPNGNVYVADSRNYRFQYFTANGSYLGRWPFEPAEGLAIAPNGNVYTGGCIDEESLVYYFNPTGSILGSWITHPGSISYVEGGDVAPNGNVYVAGQIVGFFRNDLVVDYYTGSGSVLGSWYVGNGTDRMDVGIAPNGNVYVIYGGRIIYFTANGSLLGSWGSTGSGPGQFRNPKAVDVGPQGRVFVADTGNDRIQYFTAAGSFLGMWGREGSGPGEFINPSDVRVSYRNGRVYVADRHNHRIQYFVEDIAVRPTSLGKVKALFR